MNDTNIPGPSFTDFLYADIPTFTSGEGVDTLEYFKPIIPDPGPRQFNLFVGTEGFFLISDGFKDERDRSERKHWLAQRIAYRNLIDGREYYSRFNSPV